MTTKQSSQIDNFSRSNEYRSKIHDLIPGGAHTYSKGDDQFPLLSPAAITHGKGCYVWDPDGNKYIECLSGLASVSLGHAYEPVVERVIQELHKGNNFSRPSVIEKEMAERFLSLIGVHDMIKFAKNGSVVTTAAVKIARAYSGRKLVARPAEHPFYSYDDWFIGSTDVKSGIPNDISDLTVQYKADNLQSLTELFEKYPGQIACVISEPEKMNVLADNYLKNAIDLAHKHGALWIMDEMITGFKTDYPGSMKKYNVVPDMTTWGKGIANGFSFCCLTGKKEVMELGGIRNKGKEKLFLISTTHGGETSSIAAGLATMDEFDKHPVLKHNQSIGQKFIDGSKKIFESHKLSHSIKNLQFNWHASLGYFNNNGENSFGLRTLFHQEMIKHGVLFQGIFCPNFSHTEKEIEHILNAMDEACVVYKKGLEEGYEKYLVGEPIKPVFRKYI
ncbi:MAG TPA: glutamate-1-semialdehyde 2,1-aminomutase [Bacteroidia bacterium]|jgi:glutamate-1-semialdehyde 2,1-aminomutase|nr:glutamate-1-semialdehyde 2,1-aminomutase [Bacteroidia bacterium]